MSTEGVDYAFPPIPSAASLRAAGKVFACRYGGPGSDSKQLHAAELAALTAAGIYVVANAEGTADGLKGGYTAGRSWAQQAEAHFRALGMPADRPIYLSVDFDADSSHWAALNAAMQGAGEILGRSRVGVYGGYDVINHFASMKDRIATWYWQTYAWSGGRWHPAAHIRQWKNGVALGGADVDLNTAMVADYGQWKGPAVTDYSEAEMRAFPWQYNGRGIADNNGTTVQRTTLSYFDEMVRGIRTLPAMQSKIDGLTTTVEALATALASGGTDIDTAAILKRIDDRAAEDAARAEAHAAEVDELQTEIRRLTVALAKAGEAQAALDDAPAGS